MERTISEGLPVGFVFKNNIAGCRGYRLIVHGEIEGDSFEYAVKENSGIDLTGACSVGRDTHINAVGCFGNGYHKVLGEDEFEEFSGVNKGLLNLLGIDSFTRTVDGLGKFEDTCM